MRFWVVLLVPQALAPALVLCNGTREDASAQSVSLAVRHGLRISSGVVEQLLTALGDLSHVGPAFGGLLVDFAGLAWLQAADDELIECARAMQKGSSRQ